MFKSDRQYSGLDDLFRTSNNNTITGLKAVSERIKELDLLYIDWQYNSWNFTSDSVENDYLRNEMWESIEIMRSSSLNYIIGEFNSSIVASSEAVERVCNIILYMEFRKTNTTPKYQNIKPDWIKVDTVNGTIYYTTRWNKVIKLASGYIIYCHNTLNFKTLKNLEALGYSCGHLLNDQDILEKNVFVERRNASAHGDFSRIPIVQQLHGYVVSDPNDLFKLYNNKEAALDQYKKASNFIISVINEFNKRYI